MNHSAVQNLQETRGFQMNALYIMVLPSKKVFGTPRRGFSQEKDQQDQNDLSIIGVFVY